MRWLVFLAACTAGNGLFITDDGGGATDGPPLLLHDLSMMSVPPDLAMSGGGPDLTQVTVPPDLRSVDFSGVSCGPTTCNASQVCCVQQTTGGPTAACVAPGGCPDAGLAAACDGPEDCEPSKANCCVTLSGANMSGSGTAGCSATCDGSLTATGGFTVRTKLCHSDSDCTGFTGMFNGNSSAWDSCCHNGNAGATGPHFCAAAAFAGFGGYTCP